MRYQHYASGDMRDTYPHPFGEAHLDALEGFLATGDVTPVRWAQYGTGEARNLPGTVVLRHDVDHNLDYAIRLAEWEAERGYRATYYVLPTAWYWWERSTVPNLRRLVSLGHEVGIHNDSVAEAYRQGYIEPVDGSGLPAGHCEKAAEILKAQIDQVRDLGIRVSGTSAHGSPLWREAGITNVFLWSAGYTADDFGLEYADAYHLHRKALYLSDNRAQWPTLRREPGRETHLLLHPHQIAMPEAVLA
jgi:hypothetical protein